MNWRLWSQWAAEHQSRALFLVFLLLGASGAVFAPIAAMRLTALTRGVQPRYRLAGHMVELFLGYAAQIVCSLIANINPVQGGANGIVHSNSWHAWWFWIGQGCMWFVYVRAARYVMMPNGDVKRSNPRKNCRSNLLLRYLVERPFKNQGVSQ